MGRIVISAVTCFSLSKTVHRGLTGVCVFVSLHRIKRGTDSDASIIGRIMPAIISDMFSPADVLNRVLSEFITARPAAARCLTPTIFKV